MLFGWNRLSRARHYGLLFCSSPRLTHVGVATLTYSFVCAKAIECDKYTWPHRTLHTSRDSTKKSLKKSDFGHQAVISLQATKAQRRCACLSIEAPRSFLLGAWRSKEAFHLFQIASAQFSTLRRTPGELDVSRRSDSLNNIATRTSWPGPLTSWSEFLFWIY